MFSLIFNFIIGAGVLLFVAVEQAKISNRSVKRDLLLFSVAVAVAWLVNSGLLVAGFLAW